MAKPVFYNFPVSHFCEKAQWALDHHGGDYETVSWVPGFHAVAAKRMGMEKTWVPILRKGDGALIQGSGAIIDVLDRERPDHSLTPRDPALATRCAELEVEIDKQLGEGLRRIAYAALLNHPALTVKIWTHGISNAASPALRVLWPLMKRTLSKSYRLTPERVERSRAEVDALLDRLDARVSTHEYLIGDSFSRADLAAAALFSSVLDPAERPWRIPVDVPPDLDAVIAPYRDRPFWAWAERMYQKHRAPFRG